ncbi:MULTISPECIES: 2'-phosphotransferase [Burkholderia]|uniref:2'-phosphotransferase n=1 Tax=Burkholderia TaxID=32008 RepID=UPI001FC879EF|nr:MULTISPECIES: 2'-phosphotransferase [Burkholderia]
MFNLDVASADGKRNVHDPLSGRGDECGELYMEPVPFLGGSMQFSASKSATMGKPDARMCKDEVMADSEDRAAAAEPGVHLSAEIRTALAAARYGVPAILAVKAKRMHRQGHAFFAAENGAEPTDAMPAEYLELIDTHAD